MCSSTANLCMCIPLPLQHTLAAFNNCSSHAHHQIFYSHTPTVCYSTVLLHPLQESLNTPWGHVINYSSLFFQLPLLYSHCVPFKSVLAHSLQNNYFARFCQLINLSLHILHHPNSTKPSIINFAIAICSSTTICSVLLYSVSASCTPTCIQQSLAQIT